MTDGTHLALLAVTSYTLPHVALSPSQQQRIDHLASQQDTMFVAMRQAAAVVVATKVAANCGCIPRTAVDRRTALGQGFTFAALALPTLAAVAPSTRQEMGGQNGAAAKGADDGGVLRPAGEELESPTADLMPEVALRTATACYLMRMAESPSSSSPPRPPPSGSVPGAEP